MLKPTMTQEDPMQTDQNFARSAAAEGAVRVASPIVRYGSR